MLGGIFHGASLLEALEAFLVLQDGIQLESDRGGRGRLYD